MKTIYNLILINYFALLIWLFLTITWLNPSTAIPVAINLFILLLPFTLPLTGVLKHNNKAILSLTYFSIFYFIISVTELYLQFKIISLVTLSLTIGLYGLVSWYLYKKKK